MEDRKLLIEFNRNGNIDCSLLDISTGDIAVMLYSVSCSMPEFKVALMAVAKTLTEENQKADED